MNEKDSAMLAKHDILISAMAKHLSSAIMTILDLVPKCKCGEPATVNRTGELCCDQHGTTTGSADLPAADDIRQLLKFVDAVNYVNATRATNVGSMGSGTKN